MPTGADPATCGYGEVVIWFLRHGDAEDSGGDDAARRLTAKGERQARDAGRALARLDVTIDACLASPKVRALATAELACEALGVTAEAASGLRGGDFDPAELTVGRGDVLLVGHEPDFSRAIQRTTGARVTMKKGGLAAVEDGVLVSLVRPRQIRAIADG
jgi:phosphohistidine phosphatase